MTRFARLATAAAFGAATIAVPLAAPAQASGGAQTNNIHTVCAQDLYVRDKASGVVIGTLYYGDSFDFISSNGNGWDYGYAFGHVNRNGWVQAGWFC
jgi:hypothetical protein